MVRPVRSWRVDWAGPHGTAWGTVNGILTPIAVVTAGHHWAWRVVGMPVPAVAVGVATLGILGVVAILAAAAVSGPVNRLALGYRLGCWTGATVWAAVAVCETDWTARGVLSYTAVLVAGGLTAGGIVTLASGGGDDQDTPPQASPPSEGTVDARPWLDALTSVTGIAGLAVLGVEPYPNRAPDGRPVGRYVEVRLPPGPLSWRAIHRFEADLTTVLTPDRGCSVRVVMGRDRKHAICEVTQVNMLATERPYPREYGPLSVHEPLPMMSAADGTTAGPTLREHCVGIFGEAGSGKSNAAQVFGVGVARMRDALLCDLDCTGNRLSGGLLRPFLTGQVDRPAVWWAATDAREAWLMLRALQRIAIARNDGYGDLCVQANDDKVPISPLIPQLIVRGDEIARFASLRPEDPGVSAEPGRPVPDLHHLALSVVNEGRAPGIRMALFGLRATNDVIGQDVQAQLHGVGVLRATSAAEYRWAFQRESAADPTEAPWPGCIQMRRSSTDHIAPYHVWRIKPAQLGEAAVAVAGRLPELDELSWLAANGRDIDGEPFEDLFPGELDCAETRWDRYRAKYARPAGGGSGPVVAARPARGEIEEDRMTEPDGRTLGDAVAELRRIEGVLRGHVEAAASADDRGDEGDGDGDPVDPAAWAAVVAAIDAPTASWREHALGAIGRAGAEGIGPADILAALATHGQSVSRETLHRWLREGVESGRLRQLGRGLYAVPDGS